MGAFGSVLGGIMAVGSVFLGTWVTFVFTDGKLALLWFVVFGFLGGFALGALNSRKAKSQASYKNEYTAYVGMALAAIIFLGIYYLIFALDRIEEKIPTESESSPEFVVIMAMISGFTALFGVGLTIANMLADGR